MSSLPFFRISNYQSELALATRQLIKQQLSLILQLMINGTDIFSAPNIALKQQSMVVQYRRFNDNHLTPSVELSTPPISRQLYSLL